MVCHVEITALSAVIILLLRRAGTGPAGPASAGPIISNVFVFFPL